MVNNFLRKGMVLVIIFLFIGTSIVPNFSADSPVKGNTIYVDDDADPSWYNATQVKTIQEGIDNATTGETIYVFNGTYYENVIINKTVNLIGEDRNTTIIDGNGTVDVINITANWVNITNFGIRNKDYLSYLNYKHGIKISASSNNKISNCNIYNNSYGIYQVSSSNNNTISGNNISNNLWGFYIRSHNSNNTLISDNTFFSNKRIAICHHSERQSPSSGTYIDTPGNHNTTIIGNIISMNIGYAYDGISLDYSSNNVISDNIISNYRYSIPLWYSSNNTISDNIIIKGMIDISDYSNNNTILNNTISNFSYGIRLFESSKNIILYNTLSKSDIYLRYSNNNIISDNTVLNNDNYGIYIGDNSNNNTITNNNVSNNRDGINIVYSSTNNTVSGNNIYNNSYSGVFIGYSSHRNNISDNAFINGGLRVWGSYQITVSNNTINGKPLIYLEDESDIVIHVDAGQVILVNCDNITVQNQEISNVTIGIILWGTNNSLILNNTIRSNNVNGLYLQGYSNFNTIKNNKILNDGNFGVYIDKSSHNTITGNNISNKDYYGIYNMRSSNNNITNNNVSNNGYGIYNMRSSNNNITNNNVSNNGYGIYISSYYGASNSNIVHKNHIFDNTDYGVYLSDASSENWILQNDFIDNNEGNVQAYDADTNNHWDNNTLGNYWSDYITRYPSAINISGVWNTSYSIDGGAGADDHYPSVLPIISETKPVYSYQIFPNHGPNSITISTVIVGEGFSDGATARLVGIGENNITGEDIEVLSENQMIVRFNLSWKTLGLWDVEITLQNGEEHIIAEGFEIMNFSFDIIYPDFGCDLSSDFLMNLYGLGFIEGGIVRLARDGEDDIVGENTVVLTYKHVTTRFDLTNRTVGLWNINVTLPSGHQSCNTDAFEIREGFVLNLDIQADDTQNYNISVPSSDNLFITLQKTTLTSYGNSWNGKLSIQHEGIEIASDSGSHDLILHLKNPTPGEYVVEVIAYQNGSGILTVQTSLPELPLGEWVVDTVYCSYGSVWFQIVVPPNQDNLYLDAEGMGLWSIIDVYYDQYGSSDHWRSPMALSDLQTSIEIPNPVSGTYIVEFIDSAMIFDRGIWSEDQTREILIKADTTYTVEPPPDYLPIITSINPDKGGNTGDVTVEINGGWLDENATVALVRPGFDNIVADYVRKKSDSSALQSTFNLVNQESGEWTLVLTNPNGKNVTAQTNFTIEEGGDSELWLEIIGREKTRVGREQTYLVRYGNRGNIDVQDVILGMIVPSELQYQLNLPTTRPDLDPIERSKILISALKIPANSYEEFTFKLFSSEVSKYSLSAGFFTPPRNIDSSQPGENGGNSDEPKPGAIVFRYWWGANPGWDPGHDGIYYKDDNKIGWVIDFRDDGIVHKVRFDVWKTENGVNSYIGHAYPPGWTDTIGLQIADYANKREGEKGTYFGLPIFPYLDNCNSWIGKVFLNNGLPFFYDAFTAPITLYQRWNGNLGNLKNYIYWLAPNQINYLLWEQLDSFLMKYFDELDCVNIQSVSAGTPEDKYGPTGFDYPDIPLDEYKRFVPADQNFYYKVDFWNKENATAPACDAYVNDQLDENLNWSTFRFEEIGFLNWTVKLEPCQYFNIYVDTRPEMDLIVNVEGIFDPLTGAINWTFSSLDPVTLETPEDPLAGFLPPINESGYEIGWVCFSIDPELDLTTGTQIENQAFVNFDGVGPFNPAPKEGPFVNTIDAFPPTSNITAVISDNYTIQLNWSGNDDLNGSGIRGYNIYLSIDNLTNIPIIHKTTNLSSEYVGEEGHIYSFYCIATDNVGNEELHPVISSIISTYHPVADAGGLYYGTEGCPVTFDGNASYDPFEDSLLFRWDFNNDSFWDTAYSTNPIANYTWYDDYSGIVVLEVNNGALTNNSTTTVVVYNVAPNITSLNLPTDPITVNTTIQLTANFTDPGSNDTHNATIEWGDGNISFVNIPEGYYTINISYNYSEAGVYTINLTVKDDDDGNDTMIFRYIVVYDPSGGFVTGGGWIDSPEGAYTPDLDLTGKANFGFVSKYKKGQQTPTGNTEFQFNAADMNFHSDRYEWLVIAGAKAMYKGNGTINGTGNYGFMISAIDEKFTPRTDFDMFRIKIWDKDDNDTVVYDNQLGDDEDADPTTQISGGQIVIHKD